MAQTQPWYRKEDSTRTLSYTSEPRCLACVFVEVASATTPVEKAIANSLVKPSNTGFIDIEMPGITMKDDGTNAQMLMGLLEMAIDPSSVCNIAPPIGNDFMKLIINQMFSVSGAQVPFQFHFDLVCPPSKIKIFGEYLTKMDNLWVGGVREIFADKYVEAVGYQFVNVVGPDKDAIALTVGETVARLTASSLFDHTTGAFLNPDLTFGLPLYEYTANAFSFLVRLRAGSSIYSMCGLYPLDEYESMGTVFTTNKSSGRYLFGDVNALQFTMPSMDAVFDIPMSLEHINVYSPDIIARLEDEGVIHKFNSRSATGMSRPGVTSWFPLPKNAYSKLTFMLFDNFRRPIVFCKCSIPYLKVMLKASSL